MRTNLRDRTRGARTRWAALRVRAAQGARRKPALPDPPSAAPGGIRVGCVVFSKDRAMQLEACLRSVDRFAPYDGAVVVIYRTTTREFEEGYRRLSVPERVRLVRQGDDFRADVVAAVDPEQEYTVFHTDDDVFFRSPPTTPALTSGFAAFSLRLGTNTTHCYTLGRRQPLPELSGSGPVIAWDWTRARDDFAYPLSLDGHIVHTELLLRLISRARFGNPNELEDELHYRRHLVPPLMLAFRESCLVSVPANVVSSTHHNREAGAAGWSAEALNARFLAGERIDLDAMDFSHVRAAHAEVPLAFKRHGA